jgi:hypothetical protein
MCKFFSRLALSEKLYVVKFDRHIKREIYWAECHVK